MANRRAKKVLLKGSFRRVIIIALVVVAAIFVLNFLGVLDRAGSRAGQFPPNEDMMQVLMTQLSQGPAIAVLDEDTSLTFVYYSDTAALQELTGGKELKPIEDNLFKKGSPNLLYDELIVGRVIKLGSDWSVGSTAVIDEAEKNAYLNSVKGKTAEEKIVAKAAGAQIAFHSMTIGEIRRAGGAYFLLTRERYTLAKDGALSEKEAIFVYELSKSSDGMYVTDFAELQ
jgi:hypothetical protein